MDYKLNSKTGAVDLDHQDQIGLQTSTDFEKNLTVCIDHLLVPSWGWLGRGDTCLLQCKERPFTS